jgi:prephenate dehydratase
MCVNYRNILRLVIASEVALGLYGLERVAKNIEDKTGNVTRFLVLGKDFGNLHQGAVHMRLLLMTLNINEE